EFRAKGSSAWKSAPAWLATVRTRVAASASGMASVTEWEGWSRANRVKLLGSSSTAETRIWAPYCWAAYSLAMAATDGSPSSMIWRTLPAVSSATALLMKGWAAKKRSHWARATGWDWMRRSPSSDEPGHPMTQWLMRKTTS